MGEATLLRPPSRRELRMRLLRLRKKARFSAAQAAKRIGVTQTTLTRIENGEIGIAKLVYVEILCDFYGADPEETARLMEIAAAARTAPRAWWEGFPNGDGPPKWFETYLGMEDEAVAIDEYDVEVVGGLLQTADYAREVLSLGPMVGNEKDVDEQLRVRMQRQAILNRPEDGPRPRPTLRVVLNEAVLVRQLGGRAVMRRQLERLLADSERDNVEVLVLPFSAGGHAGMSGGSFNVLRFPDPGDAGAVYSDQHSGALILEEEADVERHRLILASVQASALDVEGSRDLIRRVATGR